MRPKIMFVIAEDRLLWSHRLPIARAALRSGYEVIIVTRVLGDGQKILDEGFRVIPVDLKRGSYNPLVDLRQVLRLRKIYSVEKPNLVHHVALKPVLCGTAAALARKNIKVINALTGLGFLVTSKSLKAKVLRPFIWALLRFLLRQSNQHVLLQNEEDKLFLTSRLGARAEHMTLIRGSGVNVNLFRPTPEPPGVPVVLLASRMLWIKGIREFVEAAKLLRDRGVVARFVLVGDSDFANPSSVPRQQLIAWQASGAVEWWGHRKDMPAVLSESTIVALPSQGGEGVPKALLEAAASGRAMVTTDVPGCRDVVQEGVSGKLVSPGNPGALADAIEELLNDQIMRKRMAEKAREIAVNCFSEEQVVAETLRLYCTLLDSSSLPLAAVPSTTYETS